MHLVIFGWIYVVLMMAVSEANSTQGTLLGAFFTFVLYGVLPLSIVVYLMNTPARRAKRQASTLPPSQSSSAASALPADAPDGSGLTARDALPAERKEP